MSQEGCSKYPSSLSCGSFICCMCTLFTNMHIYLSAGSTASHAVVALLENSSPPQKNVWAIQMNSLGLKMSICLCFLYCVQSFSVCFFIYKH